MPKTPKIYKKNGKFYVCEICNTDIDIDKDHSWDTEGSTMRCGPCSRKYRAVKNRYKDNVFK